MSAVTRSERAVDTLMRTDPQFVELCKMLYGPGVDADAVYADVFAKMNPGSSDVSVPGGISTPGAQRRRKALAVAALAGTGAGALTAVRDIQNNRRKLGRIGVAGPLALGADVLAGGELYQHLKSVVGKQPVNKASLSALTRGSLTQHRRLVRATLDATRLPSQTAANYVDRAAKPAVVKRVGTVSADWAGTFTKVADDKRLALGWASICKVNGLPVVDRQGDFVDADDLEDVVYRYVERSRVGGDMHDRAVGKSAGRGLWVGLYGAPEYADAPRQVADLVESVIITKAKKEAMGLPDDYPEGWWVGFRYHDDEVWKSIKNGERTGFSIHGAGLRKSIDYDDLMAGV